MSSDKRSHPRFEIEQLVEVDFGHEKFIRAEGINLSRSGILCKTENECQTFENVFIMMTLPYNNKERIINLEGIVMRSVKENNKWETAISITGMSPASREIFDEVMDKFSPLDPAEE